MIKRNSRMLLPVVLVLLLIIACAPPAAPTAAPKAEPKAAATTAVPPSAPSSATAAPPAPSANTPAPVAKAAAPTPTPVAKIKRGGTLVFGSKEKIASLDPIFDTEGKLGHIAGIIEGLVRLDPVDAQGTKTELRPWLAESWQQVDPKTIVIKLRKGVKFHDGSEMTADVVKWSLERMGNNPKSLSKSSAANFASLEVVDPYTLRINYKVASAVELMDLTIIGGGSGNLGPAILSKAQMDKVGEEAFGAGAPSATGPLKVVEWKRDDVLVVAKAENYWQKGDDGQPLPYLDGARIRTMADSAVGVLELRAGTMHVVYKATDTDVQTTKSNPDLVQTIIPGAGSRWYYGFNPVKEPFGTNVKLRQAANYATDHKRAAEVLGGASGMPNYFVTWSPGILGYDPSLPHYEFDLNKAIQLVKEAGFPDGVDIEYMHWSDAANRKLAEMHQEMWRRAGIRVKLDAIDRIAGLAKIKAGDFDLAAGSSSYSPDPAAYDRKYTCDGSANNNNYCNPELDKCLAEGKITLDNKQRTQVYNRCWKIIYEDALLNGIYIDGLTTITRKEVKGLTFQTSQPEMDRVWLDK